MSGVVGGGIQNQQQAQQTQWFKQQQMQQQQQQQQAQQQQQQQQPILIQRQIPGMGNNMGMGGPGGYMARPRQPQMSGMNQGGYQNVYNAEQQQQQGMKPNQTQQAPVGAVSVLSSQLQGGGGIHQVVMGPPGSQHASMQQQMMSNVRSPPPITSPAAPSPRPAPSPRAQPSPHHLPSHSPVPGNDMHNHLGHPHQSPLPAMNDNVMNDNQLNAQEQLSKFVEKL